MDMHITSSSRTIYIKRCLVGGALLVLSGVCQADLSLTAGGAVTAETFDSRYARQSASPDRVRIVSDPKTGDSNVFLFELLKEDVPVARGLRSEVFAKHETITEGRRWYAFSYYFPADWKTVAKDHSIIIGQVHTSQSKPISLSPPFALLLQGEQIFLLSASNTSGWSDPTPPTQESSSIKKIRIGSVKRNDWSCFVLEADWGWRQGTGNLKIWLNGEVVYFSKKEPNSYHTDLGNYPKIGMYAPYGLDQPSRRLYADFIRIGENNATYEKMARATPCGLMSSPPVPPEVLNE